MEYEASKRKIPAGKEAEGRKKICKPESMEDGASTPRVAEPRFGDVNVYPFGAGKRLPQEEAPRLSVNPASVIRGELNISPINAVRSPESPHGETISAKEVSTPPTDHRSARNPMDWGSFSTEMKTGGGNGHWRRGGELLPLGFRMLDLDDPEEEPRSLRRMNDDWMYAHEITPVLGSRNGDATDRENATDIWRNEYKTKIEERPAHFVENAMARGPDVNMSRTDSLPNAQGRLAGGGSRMEHQLATGDLQKEKHRGIGRACNARQVRIIRGS